MRECKATLRILLICSARNQNYFNSINKQLRGIAFCYGREIRKKSHPWCFLSLEIIHLSLIIFNFSSNTFSRSVSIFFYFSRLLAGFVSCRHTQESYSQTCPQPSESLSSTRAYVSCTVEQSVHRIISVSKISSISSFLVWRSFYLSLSRYLLLLVSRTDWSAISYA